jgi:hypothetical protein
LDVAGVALSAVCIVHCIAAPLALLALPLAVEDRFHAYIFPLVALIALVAVGRGVLRHGRRAAIAPLIAGLGLLAVVAVYEPGGVTEVALSIVAGALLISAHWLNVRCSQPACACPVDHVLSPDRPG